MTFKRYYPAFLDLVGKHVVVIGGGEVAERKALSLLECGAYVHIISPELTPRLEELVATGKITVERRFYTCGDLRGCFLVIGATNDEDVNHQVFAEAEERRILCNIVDAPHLCSFIAPSVISRGDLQIAISTNGKSPMLSRRIREHIEAFFGEEYAGFVNLLGDLREEIQRRFPDEAKRREVIERLVYSDIPGLIKAGQQSSVQEIVSRCVSLSSD
ncbi:MAG: bifunctional precorrin-2 dehydrogenase/sirohydrochlorin ferrochelatase [Candidatus Latescibacteria bacterium]|nr:bifunctional precorrin-2 dehydrogenase/sirohydrochlorin ferrochelatase [Candidatus Latescibacterota bacterium]